MHASVAAIKENSICNTARQRRRITRVAGKSSSRALGACTRNPRESYRGDGASDVRTIGVAMRERWVCWRIRPVGQQRVLGAWYVSDDETLHALEM